MARLYIATSFLLLAVFAKAGDDLKSVFADYETAYLSNDAKAVKKWLAKDAEISQALHVEGIGTDSISVSVKQLLGSMSQMPKPSTIPPVDVDAISVEMDGDSAFCGKGEKVMDTVVSGELYEQREVKTVCFEHRKGKWTVVRQTIDVYYQKASNPD